MTITPGKLTGKVATAIWMIENGNPRFTTELTNLILKMESSEMTALKCYGWYEPTVNMGGN